MYEHNNLQLSFIDKVFGNVISHSHCTIEYLQQTIKHIENTAQINEHH